MQSIDDQAKILITGGTGFVGHRVVERVANPLVLTRSPDQARKRFASLDRLEVMRWADPPSELPPLNKTQRISAVVNLMGESVAGGRWTASKKERIRDSRIDGTRNLIEGLAQLKEPPEVMVSASAIGYYGSRSDELLQESSSHGNDFLAEVCQEWEAAADQAQRLGTRVVKLRIGLVLGPDGGAMSTLLPVFRWGVGGPVGSGKQWMSWIHVDDLVRLILFCIETPTISGPVNAVSPNPVPNREFVQQLGTALGRPAVLPVPSPMLKLALGDMAQQTLLASQRVEPQVAQQHEFPFLYEKLDKALEDVVVRAKTAKQNQ